MNISHINQGDPTIKRVLVYLNGTFDPQKNIYPEKDLTLPLRLYPNAEFAIRCNCSEKAMMKNYQFFKRLYGDRKFKLVSDKNTYETANVDVIWYMVDYVYIFFGGVIDKVTFDKYIVTQNTKAKVHILFNDEVTKKYEPLWDYVQHRTGKFLENNKALISQMVEKSDWSNVTLICNQDMFSQWVNDRVIDRLKPTINIAYLSDKILYELPDMDSLIPTVGDNKNGLFIGRFIPSRIKFWNKFMVQLGLSMEVHGPDTEKLKAPYTGSGKSIGNGIAKEMYRSTDYAYSVYFGKGTPSAYLGATFYEPILLGKPVFVWDGTDPDKKLFPGIPCYYSDAAELAKMLESHTQETLTELWDKQRNAIANW